MNGASLSAIATSVAAERDLKTVLNRIVAELAAQASVALARIWLVNEPTTEERFDDPKNRSLRLAASAGGPLSGGTANWFRLDGTHQTVQIGAGKIGRIAATGIPIQIEHADEDDRWVTDQKWIIEESIKSFAGHPLTFRDNILGVLGLFSRERLTKADFDWLRAFADQTAIAIANARAFQEIESLRRRLELENRYLREEIDELHSFGSIIGDSAALAKILEQIELVAPTRASVLILGESGTGKELVARAIHQRSTRRERPLVKVNCAAVPRELFESEFFGHSVGSFTGAMRDRVGRFQLAHGGTLFLDEVGDIPLEAQGKLLHALQDGRFERIGEDETRKVDVRVIAATNRDLQADIVAGRFRQDLFFRLSVFPIHVLALRERPTDIPLLAKYFLERACGEMRRPVPPLSIESVNQLSGYPWPGNVRELQNVIERAVINANDGAIDFDGLLNQESRVTQSSVTMPKGSAKQKRVVLSRRELLQIEKENLEGALVAANGKVYGPRGAAELLGMRPTTLASRLRKLGINKPR
ncbi:MAG TPA: sigma 54-interacting transcriptional regulator [Pirellulales bacterium]|jgi:transcriptional regulator with GAF, ATPase, and Fis domain